MRSHGETYRQKPSLKAHTTQPTDQKQNTDNANQGKAPPTVSRSLYSGPTTGPRHHAHVSTQGPPASDARPAPVVSGPVAGLLVASRGIVRCAVDRTGARKQRRATASAESSVGWMGPPPREGGGRERDGWAKERAGTWGGRSAAAFTFSMLGLLLIVRLRQSRKQVQGNGFRQWNVVVRICRYLGRPMHGRSHVSSATSCCSRYYWSPAMLHASV